MKIRTYSELCQLADFHDRFTYLKLNGGVGRATFGFDRWINQRFYQSHEWKRARDHVVMRDNGCDLGIDGMLITHNPVVHHMNPMEPDDIIHGEEWIIDPEFLILCSHDTHNAIHYGTDGPEAPPVVTERRPGDTKLW